jgi:hypothetical protein
MMSKGKKLSLEKGKVEIFKNLALQEKHGTTI